MKKLIVLVIILTKISGVNGQCNCNYNYSGSTIDSVIFSNLSTVSNAHYYWNFGDGSGSNDMNPVHVYPDDGKYLVTLYGFDTISKCSDFYESWINVIKPDTIPCNVLFNDTIIGNNFQTIDLSSNCGGLGINCNVMGPSENYCGPDYLDSLWGTSLFLHGMQAYTNDSINGYGILKGYYKTVPFQFDPNINYQNCSSNFEVTMDYQGSGALVNFTAMNKSGVDTFFISGLGNPIVLPGHAVSYFFNYISYQRNKPWIINYHKTDASNNCISSSTQQILIHNPFYTLPENCITSVMPLSQTVTVGANTEFIVSTSPNVTKQWQQDAGLGYIDLTNAGAYSGVHTDTLMVSNVQLTMNNYYYRCVISNSQGNCHNTTSSAILTVHPVGIDEVDLQNIKIYPNPVIEYLTFSLPLLIEKADIKIFNVLGELEYHSPLSNLKSTIDVSNLSKGIYMLEVVTQANIGRQKFMKE
jgi:hypothetical protein